MESKRATHVVRIPFYRLPRGLGRSDKPWTTYEKLQAGETERLSILSSLSFLTTPLLPEQYFIWGYYGTQYRVRLHPPFGA